MPFCPECKYEYLPEVTHCTDCNRKLVPALPDEFFPDEENWLPLRDLPGALYAEMVKEVLDKNGIPSYIKADVLSSAYGVKSAGAPGSTAQIFVPEKYHERCKQIILDMMDHI